MSKPVARIWTSRWTPLLTVCAVCLLIAVVLYNPERKVVEHTPHVDRIDANIPDSKLPLEKQNLGPSPEIPEIISNVQIVDFDDDGQLDILACDARQGKILSYQQQRGGAWSEHVLSGDNLLAAPAHALVVDLDRDGDSDIIVSALGRYSPTDERVGCLTWLENTGNSVFEPHVLLDDVRRVAHASPGDFDGDGDIDLVVAVFGYRVGQILWLENDGKNRFRDRELLGLPGAIHARVDDFDDDGDLDIVAIISQDEETVWGFENLNGKPVQWKRRRIFTTPNFDLGSSGLFPCDLDQDGDTDFLLTAGDNLELVHNYLQPWHGCFWLENRGEWKFVSKRIATLGGTYAAAAGDLDADSDVDVVLVSLFNNWRDKDSASVVWLENDGRQDFKMWKVADTPIQLASVACGDLNGDGRADIVTGSFHIRAPYADYGRVTTWFSAKK